MGYNNDFYCEVDENFPSHVIDEKGNQYLELCKFRWNGKGEYKLGLRKVYSNADGEHPGKSISFLTEDGPHDLTLALVSENFGNADEISDICLEKRKDIVGAILKKVDMENCDEYIKYYEEIADSKENMYDPEELLE